MTSSIRTHILDQLDAWADDLTEAGKRMHNALHTIATDPSTPEGLLETMAVGLGLNTAAPEPATDTPAVANQPGDIAGILAAIDNASTTQATEWAVARHHRSGEVAYDPYDSREHAAEIVARLNTFLNALSSDDRDKGGNLEATLVSREVRILPGGWNVTGPWEQQRTGGIAQWTALIDTKEQP